MILFIINLAFLAACHAFGESAAEPKAEPPPGQWYLGASAEFPSLSFSFSDRAVESQSQQTDPNQVRFEPNTGDKIRLTAGYGPYRFSYAFTSESDSESVRTKGKTKHDDIGFSFARERWAADLSYRAYRGFYVESGQEPEVIRPDISSRYYSTEVYYSLSPEYSREPMAHLKWSSSGVSSGWLAYVTANHFEFSGDRPLLTRNGIKKVDQNAITLGGGFGGFQSTENYLLGFNLLASVGPELHAVTYEPAGTEIHEDRDMGYTFGFSLGLKGAYKWGGLQSGASFRLSLINTYIGDTGLQANSSDAEVFATYEFN